MVPTSPDNRGSTVLDLHSLRLDDIVIRCMQLYTQKNLVLPLMNKGEFDMRSIVS